MTEEEQKRLAELESENDSLTGQTTGFKRAHEQLQKECKSLLKEKDSIQSKYTKQIKEIKQKTEEEKTTFESQISNLTNGN